MPNISLSYTDAQIARAEAALRVYYPIDGSDSRTPADLIQAFLAQHLGQIIRNHEGQAAKAAIASF